MTMTHDEITTYQGENEYKFRGVRLAHATTESQDNHRWLEIDIYRTQAGTYVVEKIGMSVVYHAEGARCGSRAFNYVFKEDDRAELVPCPRCKPSARPGDIVRMEDEKHETFVSNTAEEMVVTLLPHVSLRALREAAQNDDSLRQTFFVREVQ